MPFIKLTGAHKKGLLAKIGADGYKKLYGVQAARGDLPKIVWAYWEGPASELADINIARWKEELPLWDVRVLTPATV